MASTCNLSYKLLGRLTQEHWRFEASLVNTVSKGNLKKVVGHDRLCPVPLAVGRQRQKGKFWASMVYTVSSRLVYKETVPHKGSCLLSA